MYGASYIVGSIALGANAKVTGYNQLMVAPNVTQFNIPGLTASTGTSTGTILEFDSACNILPTAGTYKTVLAIDTAIAAINALIIFGSLTQLYQAQRITSPLSHGGV